MRIDYEYVAEILEAFLESDKPALETDYFSSLIEEDRDKFFFHFVIMAEQSIIASALSKATGIGVAYNHRDERYDYSVVPLRLTANGHDFANALTKPSVLDTIQKKFKNEGFSVVVDIAKTIVTKKAEALLAE